LPVDSTRQRNSLVWLNTSIPPLAAARGSLRPQRRLQLGFRALESAAWIWSHGLADGLAVIAGFAVHRLPKTHRYQLTDEGMRTALFYTRLYSRLLRPAMAPVTPPGDPASQKAFSSAQAAHGHEGRRRRHLDHLAP
jgi:hypothetical protein